MNQLIYSDRSDFKMGFDQIMSAVDTRTYTHALKDRRDINHSGGQWLIEPQDN